MPDQSYSGLTQAYHEAQRRALRYSVIHHPDTDEAKREVEDLNARLLSLERQEAFKSRPGTDYP